MEKYVILFLSILLTSVGSCQSTKQKSESCDCSSSRVQDSLITRYLENGGHRIRHGYNNEKWPLYCDSIIAICPNVAYAYQQKALPCIKNGQYEKAFALEDKAVELAPEVYLPYRAFLKCIFTKDYEGAILDFQKSQNLLPGAFEMDHSYFFWIGVSYLELDNYVAAETHLKQDIWIQTKGDSTVHVHFNSLFYMGILYLEMKQYARAKSFLTGCLSKYPQHPDAHYYLAKVYAALLDSESESMSLLNAKKYFEAGYGFNEDNVYYANYPHQIGLYEVNKALQDK